MTKINKLVITGFKSFATKTELVFGDTINTILGPNGNGKSNVLDALCFALGRGSSKSLRAEKTANLIFNGGKTKKGAEKGQVDVHFDNASKIFPVDTPEVKVSRVIKKNGQSVYKINDKTHTRSEILDLLSAARIDPDGFNIILQGDITRFVEMTSVERRQILEEISGISVYEERKHKALLELDKVEKQINDAEIILKERKTHLKELKSDRDQALKFKELKDNIDSNKATYIHVQAEKKHEVKSGFEKEHETLKTSFDKVEKQIEEHRTAVEENKAAIKKINDEIEQKGEIEQIKLSKEIENMRVDLEKHKARVVMIKDALVKIKQRRQALDKDMKDIEQGVTDLKEKQQSLGRQKSDKEKELHAMEQKIAEFKKKNKMDSLGDIEHDIEAVDKLIEEKQEHMQTIRQQQQELLREKDKVEYQLQTIDERSKKVSQVAKENQKQILDLKSKKDRFKFVTLDLNKCLDKDTQLSRDIGTFRKETMGLEEEHAKLAAKNVTVQERVGGDIAVKKILAQKKSGVYGTIAELGKVSSKYSLALEIAAGSRLMSIVVESDSIAAQCIKYLRDNKFGVATFIPLNTVRTPQPQNVDALLKKSGVHNRCVDLVQYDSKYAKAFKYVFGDTLVVESLETARDIGVGKARMVTLQGDLADTSGIMRGGFHHRKGSASFSDSDAEEDLLKVESRMGQLRSKVDMLTKEKGVNEQSILQLRREKLELEVDVAKMEKTLHLGADDLDATTQEKSVLEKQLAEITKKLNDIQNQVNVHNRDLT